MINNPFKPLPVYYCHLHPLEAANCCRNSRLVVDKGDLKWVKNCHVLVNQFHGIFNSKTPSCHGCRKIKPVFRDVK